MTVLLTASQDDVFSYKTRFHKYPTTAGKMVFWIPLAALFICTGTLAQDDNGNTGKYRRLPNILS